MKKLIIFPVLVCLSSVYGFHMEPDLRVQKWTPVDLEFKTKVIWRFSPTSPFDVSFSADITGPDNIKFTLPGFYDGDDTWKTRFSPTKEGEWNITTRSEVIELDNQQMNLLCIKNENEYVHGGILVDPENPRHFIYEDGTRWFPMGYEANWLFAMDMDRKDKTLPTLYPFLDEIAKYGFNFILLNVYAYDAGYYDRIVDFRSHQEQTNHLHATVINQLALNNWPVFNLESSYEHGTEGPFDVTYGRGNSPEEVIKAMWEIQMVGGYNAYYYTYTAWDVIRPDDTPPGYDYVKLFTDFFSNTQYWLLKSDNSLVSSGYCLANPGKEYIIYLDKAIPFVLNLSGLSKPLQAVWFQPFSGKYRDAGKFNNGKVELTPPSRFGPGPVVLYVGK